MCAAPGSKTAQLIEMLHAEDSEDNPVPCEPSLVQPTHWSSVVDLSQAEHSLQ